MDEMDAHLASLLKKLYDTMTSTKGRIKYNLVIDKESPNPLEKPKGIGWKKAMKVDIAVQNATSDLHVKLGSGVSGFYYK